MMPRFRDETGVHNEDLAWSVGVEMYYQRRVEYCICAARASGEQHEAPTWMSARLRLLLWLQTLNNPRVALTACSTS